MPNETDEQFMQHRLLIASVLSAVALMAYMYVQGPTAIPPEEPAKTEQQVVLDDPSATTKTADEPGLGANEKPDEPETPPDEPQSAEVKAAQSETESTVETDVFKVVFSNKGAVVKSWVLKDYMNAKRDRELDLVHQGGANDNGYPFEIDLPLFLPIMIALLIGLGNGFAFEWLLQGKHRRAARRMDSELKRIKTDDTTPSTSNTDQKAIGQS